MKKPNLLFIYTDEQAFNTLKLYGNSRIEMPNLNWIAGQSTVFDQAYVTQPICTPSRSSLLTGLYPHTNGCTENNVPLSPETRCLPEMFSNGNYSTAHYGKWHLGDELFAQHGFQEWVSIEDAYNKWFTEGRDRNVRSDYHHFLLKNGIIPKNGKTFSRAEAARLPEKYGKPAFLAEEASRFLRENRNNPFVLYVNFLEPHMPFFGPRDGQYDADTIPLSPNFEAVPGPAQPLKARVLYEHYLRNGYGGTPLADRKDWQRMIARYWGLCSLIDTYIGQILGTLDHCGLAGNTIVVFTSDHGDMMGAHRLLAKSVMFQEAIRVPLMIRMPGQTKTQKVKAPVSQIDVVPTLLDLMGQPPREEVQGKSLRPWMENPAAIHDQPVVVEWNGPDSGMENADGKTRFQNWMPNLASQERINVACSAPGRSIITPEGWKFNCNPLGEHELYYLEKDPFEICNVFEQNKEHARKLRDQLVNWQQRTGDTVQLPAV